MIPRLKTAPFLLLACSLALVKNRNTVDAFTPSSLSRSLSAGCVPCRNVFLFNQNGKTYPGHTTTTTTTTRTTETTTTTSLPMANNNEAEVIGKDRLLSCLPYLLPLLDGDSYGRFIFRAFPPLGIADAVVLGPLKLIYTSIPFFGLIAFFGLTFLSRSADIPRSIRFNMQQAVILDIFLIFPSLVGQLGRLGGGLVLPRVLVESGTNFVFYCLVFSVGYAFISNLTGKVPNKIPIISDATEAQIGPF